MSDSIVSVQNIPSNQGVYALPIGVKLCPYCGTRNGIITDEWQMCARLDEPYHCRKCKEDMQAVTVDKLSESHRNVLQAIAENEPVRLDELIKKSGAAASTVDAALKKLRVLGVRSTGSGYVASGELKEAAELVHGKGTHTASPADDLTSAGKAFYQAIAESSKPIKFEVLVKAAGYSASALTKCLPSLREAGVKNSGRGYTIAAVE